MKKYLLALIFTLVASTAWGAAESFYVTQSGAGSGNGSSLANAFSLASLNNAANWDTNVDTANGKIGPGDTVLISGPITGKLTVPGNGTSGHPITITNNPGEDVIWRNDTAVANTGWTGPDGNGVYTKATGAFQHLLEDGVLLVRASSTALTDGNCFYSSPNAYYKPTSGTPTDHTLTLIDTGTGGNSANMAIYMEKKSYLTFKKNTTGSLTLKACRAAISMRLPASSPADVTGLTFDGLNFSDNQDGILQVFNGEYSSSGEIKNCTFSNSDCAIRLYQGNDYTHPITWNIHHNTGTDIGFTTIGRPYDKEFIGLQNPKDCQIYNNTMIGKDDTYNSQGCIFIFYYCDPGATVSGNVCYNNFGYKYGRSGIYFSGGSTPLEFCDNLTYNNIIYCGRTDESYDRTILLDGRSVATGGPNLFYNNTIIGGYYSILFGDFHSGTVTDYNYTFKNNIFYGIAGPDIISFGVNTAANTVFDYNLYQSGKTFYKGGSSRTWSYWTTTAGQDTHSPAPADPLFAGSYTSDTTHYKLQANSPALGKGTWITGMTTDYFGKPYYNETNGVSIGASNLAPGVTK